MTLPQSSDPGPTSVNSASETTAKDPLPVGGLKAKEPPKLAKPWCHVCKCKPKTRCMFCGRSKPKKKKGEVDRAEEHLAFVKGVHTGLRKFNMGSTGSYEVDDEIKKLAGVWTMLFAPTYTENWTGKQAQEELENFVFLGAGWYHNGNDTLLVIPVNHTNPSPWSGEYTEVDRFHFHFYSNYDPKKAFEEIAKAPKRN